MKHVATGYALASKYFVPLAILLAITATAACRDAETQAATVTARGHAAADVVPGSHEDWCDEHAVPESLCTRCNPALVPAFRATGDWCVEHGLPESQCKLCNPSLTIARPPAR